MVKSLFRVNLVAAAVLAAALLAVPAPAMAGCSKKVVLYDASWCPYCKQVRAVLARNQIRYSIKDATTAQVQAEMLRRFGDTGVPRTVIGGVVVLGVDEKRIKQICRGGLTKPPPPPLPRHDAGIPASAVAVRPPA